MKTRLALLVAVSTFGAVGILAACNGEILDLGGNADGSSSANPSDGGSNCSVRRHHRESGRRCRRSYGKPENSARRGRPLGR